jgi:WD40 repeat protein
MRTDTFDCQSFRSSSHGLLTLGLSPAGHVITAGNLYDPITRVWDLRSGTAVVHESPAQCSLRVDKILFSSDGAFVVKMGVYSNETASIEIWQTMPPKILSKVDTTDGQAAPKLIALSPNDDTLVTVDRQGDVSVYRISDGGTNLAHSATYTPHLDSPIDAVAFSASTDVRLLHLDWWSHTLQCATMDLATGLSRPVSLRNPAAASWRRPQVTCTAFSRNGNRVAVGFQGGHVQPYHAMNGDAIGQPLEHHGQPDKPAITAVAFAATSDCLFTTDAAGCCWLWHIPSGHAVIAFTPDGGVEHQDVAVLSRFREMVSTWRREQRGRKDSDATIMQPSADDV